MGQSRGPKPEPAELRVLTTPAGNRVADRSRASRHARRLGVQVGNVVYAEEAHPEEIPTPPHTLMQGGRGEANWKIYWTHANAWLTEADIPAVTRICELWDQYAHIQAMIASDGGVTYTNEMRRGMSKGKQVAHPLLRELRVVSKEMQELEQDLGFNPVARARVRVGSASKESPLDQWQRRRSQRPAQATS